MFESKTDFVIDLVDRINNMIAEMSDGAGLDLDIDIFENAIELARELRDELETLADE